ncbi:DtxR family iron (metal) dependent repressor [Tamaricihabitans halophyticus]|uniref:DtxR family iron (Metal) dependent repressor n=1 Tax=Tamaricihabitans halophyticus TaxID=1262583 RepID=A0A4R2QMD1_9PSEU|nr:metal-dependent transcriptional regulator [Tamaricihabitans halophyticus]TCP50004.1 DtxR family iron (metal) dependent repressor [Tamaricihabitans halophyticus]
MTTDGLINTTEMYLKVILEFEEDGIQARRARFVERLGQRPPTVTQTVARLERNGLVVTSEAGYVELTTAGRRHAVGVLRKHRIIEVLLADVIGLAWVELHDEACRWEHVVSDRVERRIFELCHQPRRGPYGNPIPGTAELGAGPVAPSGQPCRPLPELAATDHQTVWLDLISERAQTDSGLLANLRATGIIPGSRLSVQQDAGGLLVSAANGGQLLLAEHQCAGLYGVPKPGLDRDLAN